MSFSRVVVIGVTTLLNVPLGGQEKKREMVESAFGEDGSRGTATKLTVEDLRYLFMV